MICLNTTISIITLNINQQNTPIKRQILLELIKNKSKTYICCE